MTNLNANKYNARTANTLSTLFRNDPHCDISEIPLLRKLLMAYSPELLRDTNEAQLQRNRIRAYLFEQPQLKDTGLQNTIAQELFEGLYTLKKMLLNDNWRIVEENLRQKKEAFGAKLNEMLTDEEE